MQRIDKIHKKLTKKIKFYRRWHQFKYYNLTHWLTLIVFVFGFIWLYIYLPIFIENYEEDIYKYYIITKRVKAATPSIFTDPFGTLGIDLTLKDGYAEDLGVDTTRASLYIFHVYDWPNDVWNFKNRDAIYDDPAQRNINLILTFYMPKNMDKIRSATFATYIKRTVERYDGDSDYGCSQSAPDCYSAGDNQYPTWDAAPIVKYWQIENEVDSSFAWKDNPILQSPQNYAEIVNIIYPLVKEVCSDCQVILGSSLGSLNEAQNYFNQVFPLIGNHYNAFDIHHFDKATGQYKNIETKFGYFKNKNPNVPIILTETSTYSDTPITGSTGLPKPTQTEEEQAADLVKRYIFYTSLGAKKVMWNFLYETPFGNAEGIYWYTGLIYDGQGQYDKGDGVKKLAYYTYKKLSEKTKGSNWNNIATLKKNEEGVYLFKLTKNNQPIYVAWWDWFSGGASPKTVTLPVGDITTQTALITKVIPKQATGQEILDYSTAFETETATITNGSITITLNKKPVIIEKGPEVSLGEVPFASTESQPLEQLALCQESDWVYIDSTCQKEGAFTRSWTKQGLCEGGVIYPPIEFIACVYKYKISDFGGLFNDWHKTASVYDLNKDGIVNIKDLGLMMRNF